MAGRRFTRLLLFEVVLPLSGRELLLPNEVRTARPLPMDILTGRCAGRRLRVLVLWMAICDGSYFRDGLCASRAMIVCCSALAIVRIILEYCL